MMKEQKKHTFFVLYILLSGVTFVYLLESTIELVNRSVIIKERQEALNRVEAQQKMLLKSLEEATSAAKIEREIRNKLGMVKPGESIVLMDTSQTATKEATVKTTEQKPSWSVWWKLFF